MRLLALTCAFLVGCSGGTTTTASLDPVVSLTFERIDGQGLNSIRGIIHLARGGQGITGAQPTFSSSLGSLSALTERGMGNYEFVVTPNQSGEYSISANFEGQTVSHMALVVGEVAAGWGQPMSVEGLVNSEGYEDGVTVTPDGEYLFVQYGPWRFSAITLFSTSRASGGAGGNRLVPTRFSHEWIDTVIGPTTGPQRPGLFDGRFSGNTLLHNSNLWQVGLDLTPNFAPITMFYGFHRQADGSYAEPFFLAFDDANDAIANPFGLSFKLNGSGRATILFALDDPSDPDKIDKNGNGTFDVDSRFDVFTYEVELGVNNTLGTYQVGSPPTPVAPYLSKLVDFGRVGKNGNYGTQGNPHLHVLADGSVGSIWTDDEYDDTDSDPDNDVDKGDISAYVLTSGSFPGGAWTKVVLPATVNAGTDQIQPFFDNTGLYFTEDVNIRYSAFSGAHTVAGYSDDAKWGTSTIVLGKDTSTIAVGKIIAIGEPTLATINGKRYLYFVYVRVRGFDTVTGLPDLDMQAGFVSQR